MRACFMGQNVFALGFGVATLQSPPLAMDYPACDPAAAIPADDEMPTTVLDDALSAPVTNPPRLLA